MKVGRRGFVSGTLALAGGFPSAARAEDPELVVITHKTLPVAALSRSELRQIFQTLLLRWPDGRAIVPLNLPEDSVARRTFDEAVLGLDPERVARYWIDRRIRGGERPPRRLPSPGLVVRAVAAEPGAVGYVGVADADASVRVAARVRAKEVLPP